MRRRRLTQLVLLLVALLALAAGAGAYLASTGSGSGTGGANVSLAPVTIAAASGDSQALLPTGTPSGDVKATITNPNSSSVHIGSLSLDASQGVGGFSANAASCALSFARQTNGAGGWTIPAAGQITVDLTNSLTMATSAANSCQNQTFSVYLTTP